MQLNALSQAVPQNAWHLIQVKLTTTTTVGKDGRPTSGVYRPAYFPYDAEIGVSRDSDHPVMTALHEFGHHLRHHLDENDFKSVVEAMQHTPEAQLIKEMNYDPGYWLHENELFARAYAQWVVESVNHPEARVAKEELQNIFGSAHSFEQFSGPAWQKVKTRINHSNAAERETMSQPALTIDQLRELMTKMKVIKEAYHSGQRSAEDCVAELMAAPYYSPSPSSAMRLLDPGPPQSDTPPGWKSRTAGH